MESRKTRQSVRATLLALSIAALAGCMPSSPSTSSLVWIDEQAPADALVVPGNQCWVDSGIDVRAGEPLTVTATGRIQIGRVKAPAPDIDSEVGPQGTFLYNGALHDLDFPLAAAGKGPAPCYCLIGRIGHGPAFYIGPACSWVAEHTGRLYLGVNDPEPAANCGQFFAQISRPDDVQPLTFRSDVPLDAPPQLPHACGDVVVFYIDGLRPDVVEEMAAMGHIPHLKKFFVDGGTALTNTFTAFPSDTITSNGTMWTGCFSDRHGLKGQVRFSRRRLKSDSFLEPMGPNRSSRILGPQGLDKVVQDTQAASVALIEGAEGSAAWRASQTSGTPAIYDYFRAEGSDWATGALPVMTDMPPPLWTRSMARYLPYLQAQNAWRYIDDANTNYAVRYLIRQKRPVTIIWLPETDSISHKYCRGQFGSTRHTIAMADKMVGEVVSELQADNRLDSTYLILVSDHGHLGGRTTHLSRFDLANEFFFNSRQVARDGTWLGGGLGMSVRQHRYHNRHKEDNDRQFVFVDGDSDGAARVFLPRGGYCSGDWSGPNSAAQLLAYPVAPHLDPLNLPQTIAACRAVDDNGCEGPPIDLVLMKLTDCSILITTCDRGQAVIERQRNAQGAWVYRYLPVENVHPLDDGQVAYTPVPQPEFDPLGIVPRVRRGFLQQFHDEQTWLWVTAMSDYPDSVVALTRHMLWQDNLRAQEPEYAPDLVVTARYGWFFGIQNTPGTTHGYPLAESMHATWYVSGPGVRRGARVDAPCRLVDLTPTILALTGVPHDPQRLDGRALTTIFEDIGPQVASEQPLYWRDVDLQAWQPLQYTPAETFEGLPRSINNPSSGWDINNIAYNVMTISDWSVFRLIDDIVSPLTPGRTHVAQKVERADRQMVHAEQPWVADGVHALNISGFALADYSFTSSGNLRRANSAVDWVQDRSSNLDQKLAQPIGRNTVLGTPVTNKVVDSVQYGFWEAYRFGQRVLAEVLDEVVLNGVENTVDSTLNLWRSTPAEVIVDE